jgi:hypothetical protein
VCNALLTQHHQKGCADLGEGFDLFGGIKDALEDKMLDFLFDFVDDALMKLVDNDKYISDMNPSEQLQDTVRCKQGSSIEKWITRLQHPCSQCVEDGTCEPGKNCTTLSPRVWKADTGQEVIKQYGVTDDTCAGNECFKQMLGSFSDATPILLSALMPLKMSFTLDSELDDGEIIEKGCFITGQAVRAQGVAPNVDRDLVIATAHVNKLTVCQCNPSGSNRRGTKLRNLLSLQEDNLQDKILVGARRRRQPQARRRSRL